MLDLFFTSPNYMLRCFLVVMNFVLSRETPVRWDCYGKNDDGQLLPYMDYITKTLQCNILQFFSRCKIKDNFQMKNVDFSSSFCSKRRLWVHVRTASVTKTSPCIEDPLTPHFYIVKLGFTGVYIVFLIFAQKHRMWVLVRTAPQSMF